MNCRDTRRWMSPYLDSELGKTKTFEISEHLRQCEPCAERFEREGYVDGLLADRLRQTPGLDWDEVLRTAMRKPRVFRPFQLSVLGLAACLAFVMWIAWPAATDDAARRDHWIANVLKDAAPDSTPFRRVSDASVELAALARSTLGVGLQMQLLPEILRHHVVELVSVHRRTTVDDTPYLEVRLNCCGEPVLLAVALRENAGPLGVATSELALGAVQSRTLASGVNVAVWSDDAIVVLAASSHPIDGLVSAFRGTRS